MPDRPNHDNPNHGNPNQTRRPWVAMALSLLSAGVGHVYCGQLVKGMLLFCAWFFLVPLVIVAALMSPSSWVLAGMLCIPVLVLVMLHVYAAIDSYLVARRSGANYRLRGYNRAAVYLLLIALGLGYRVALTEGVREFVFEAFYIPTRSMAPNLVYGDSIMVNKLAHRNSDPRRGDVIVFRNPGDGANNFIKRVVGLPGDIIAMRQGKLIVNGQALTRGRVPAESLLAGQPANGQVFYEENAGARYRIIVREGAGQNGELAETVVPPRSVYVLGDNRAKSRDSRAFGAIPIGDIVGHLQYIHRPAGSWARFGAYHD